MSKDELLIQYIGFRARSHFREYMFQVRRAGTDTIEFRLTITNKAFASHLLRYQDGPDICSQWIQHELGVNGNGGSAPRTKWSISEGELDQYRVAHAPKPRRGMMYKPPQNPF